MAAGAITSFHIPIFPEFLALFCNWSCEINYFFSIFQHFYPSGFLLIFSSLPPSGATRPPGHLPARDRSAAFRETGYVASLVSSGLTHWYLVSRRRCGGCVRLYSPMNQISEVAPNVYLYGATCLTEDRADQTDFGIAIVVRCDKWVWSLPSGSLRVEMIFDLRD